MTAYLAEANTGSSMWPVAQYETSPEVDAYLRSVPQFTLQIQPGNPGMFVAPRVAETLVELVDAPSVPDDAQALHTQAVRELAHLVQFTTLHHGAQINWSQAVPAE